MAKGKVKNGKAKTIWTTKPKVLKQPSGAYKHGIISPTFTYRFRFSGGTLG